MKQANTDLKKQLKTIKVEDIDVSNDVNQRLIVYRICKTISLIF
jgi:hypothetical protein